ncbi:MAG TPA: hypothetical protein VK809_06535 [Bacteroidia bacterium]|jgi:hypothetical protein|nr:hypothetical protein [Bacteroidia bacterium]
METESQLEICVLCGLRTTANEIHRVKLYDTPTNLFICDSCIDNNPRLTRFIDPLNNAAGNSPT